MCFKVRLERFWAMALLGEQRPMVFPGISWGFVAFHGVSYGVSYGLNLGLGLSCRGCSGTWGCQGALRLDARPRLHRPGWSGMRTQPSLARIKERTAQKPLKMCCLIAERHILLPYLTNILPRGVVGLHSSLTLEIPWKLLRHRPRRCAAAAGGRRGPAAKVPMWSGQGRAGRWAGPVARDATHNPQKISKDTQTILNWDNWHNRRWAESERTFTWWDLRCVLHIFDLDGHEAVVFFFWHV